MTAARLRDAVLLTGRDISIVAATVHNARFARLREGRSPDAELERVAAVLSARPQADSHNHPAHHDEHMTTSQAAELLGISARTVRRIAPQLDGIRSGNRWLVSTRAVNEHLAGRATT